MEEKVLFWMAILGGLFSMAIIVFWGWFIVKMMQHFGVI
jgi:hypothetical protein